MDFSLPVWCWDISPTRTVAFLTRPAYCIDSVQSLNWQNHFIVLCETVSPISYNVRRAPQIVTS